jgi:hypothetical protein
MTNLLNPIANGAEDIVKKTPPILNLLFTDWVEGKKDTIALREIEREFLIAKQKKALNQGITETFGSIGDFGTENIYNICQKVQKKLEERNVKFDKDKIDPTFIAEFIQNAKNTRNEELEDIWAELIATELQNPGTYSVETMQWLQKTTSKKFKRLLDFFELNPIIHICSGERYIIFYNQAIETEKLSLDYYIDDLSVSKPNLFVLTNMNRNELYQGYILAQTSNLCLFSKTYFFRNIKNTCFEKLTKLGEELYILTKSDKKYFYPNCYQYKPYHIANVPLEEQHIFLELNYVFTNILNDIKPNYERYIDLNFFSIHQIKKFDENGNPIEFYDQDYIKNGEYVKHIQQIRKREEEKEFNELKQNKLRIKLIEKDLKKFQNSAI